MSDTKSPLDAGLCITTFPDLGAKTKDISYVSLRVFSEQLRDARAPTKGELKLFSPASYGAKKTAAKALRHDNNLVEMGAIVADLDNGKISVADAVAKLTEANLCGVVATSASHTPTFPNIVCPLSDPLNRARANATGFELAEHHKLISRLAGLFPGSVTAESWNRSQSWYVGTIDGAPDHQAILIEGVCLDQLSYLDQAAQPRPKPVTKVRAPRGTRARRAELIPLPGMVTWEVSGAEVLASQTIIPDDALPLDTRAALTAIAVGENSHPALVSLCGKFAAQGLPESTAIDLLRFAADQRAPEGRDAGWKKMRASIPRTVAWAYEKEAADGTTTTAAPTGLVPIPLPSGGNGATPPPLPPGAPPPPPPGTPPPPPGAGPGPGPGPGPAPQGPHPDLGANAPEPHSDEWLALQFAEQHEGWLRHVEELGFWRLYDGVVWRKDATQRVLSRVRLLNRQASMVGVPKRNQRLKINSGRTAGAVAKLVQADRRLALADNEWDRQPMWLNTPDYVVRLSNRTQQPHQATDYLTKVTKVTPDFTADCPLWKAFLLRSMGGDQDMVDYLQRVCGYMLTGHTLEHALFFGHGTGFNGKGTFTNTLIGILGLVPTGYVAVAPTSTFTASRHEQHTTDLATMAGARCVIATETEEGRSWPMAKIKTMSGGDPITARFMHKNDFTYIPQYKIFITGNHKPRLHGVDEAIRGRLHLIPFAATIPVSERDPHLGRKLKAEYPPILAWMIQGCVAWQQQGLNPPAAVRSATSEFFADEDLVQTWLDELCIGDPTKAAYVTELYASFKVWMENAGEFVRPQRWFTTALADRGYSHKRGTGGLHLVIGLRLKTQPGMAVP